MTNLFGQQFCSTEKKRMKRNGKLSIKSELSPLQVLLFNTTPGLREVTSANIPTDGLDSSSGESQRNSNEDTVSIKSGSEWPD